LVKALAGAGHVLYLLVRDKKKADFLNNRDNIVVVEGEIQQVDSYRQVFNDQLDQVYHLAAISGQKWGADESEYYRVNVLGTANLLEVCQGKIGRFIFCSSINAISNDGFRRDPYGKSKWQAEQLVEAASLAGLETVTLRPAVVYGPGAVNGMIPNLCRLINHSVFFPIGSGRNIIPLVYIDDLIEVLIKAADSRTSGKTYEIIGPELLTLGEIVNQAGSCLGVRPHRFGVPLPLARVAAFLFELLFGLLGREPLINQHRVDSIISHRPHLNSQKAEQDLSYAPRVHFSAGIAATVDWYRQHGYL